MKKIISIIDYLLVMLISLFGFITAPFVFPLVYIFRNTKIRHIKPFWYYFDDEDSIYGSEYWRKAKGLKENFITAYRWNAIRNPAWNLHTSLKPIQGKEVLVSSKGRLTKNNKETSMFDVAVLMYEDANSNWMHNTGDKISVKYSILGSVFIWFKINGKLYWRCSYAGNIYKNLWGELQLGIGNRYTFRLKFHNN